MEFAAGSVAGAFLLTTLAGTALAAAGSEGREIDCPACGGFLGPVVRSTKFCPLCGRALGR